MIVLPKDIVRGAELMGKLDELLEWTLSTDDVARMLAVSPATVHNWRRGRIIVTGRTRRVYRLPHRAFGKGMRQTALVGYRLQDVETWADLFGLTVDYTTLPVAVQRKYQVGEFAEKATQQLGVRPKRYRFEPMQLAQPGEGVPGE